MEQSAHFSVKNLAGIALIGLSIGWLFALPLLSLSANKTIPADLLPANQAQYALLFFGYPACNQICPASLRVLSDVQAQAPTLEISFINLDFRLNAATSRAYAHHFDSDFLVYHYPQSEHLATLLKAFGVSFSRTEAQIISHTDYIYLLKKDASNWRIRHVYRHPAASARILSDLNKLREEHI